MNTDNIANLEKELEQFLKKVSKFLDKKIVDAIAKETCFVKRERKLTGFIFLSLYMFGVNKYGTPTLEDLQGLLKVYDRDFSVSRSSIHERINQDAIDFFSQMLSMSLIPNIPESLKLKIPAQFKRIWIWDSTKFQLPETLEKFFPGLGGSGKTAGIKIQFGFDLKNSLWIYSIEAGNTSDSESAFESIKYFDKGDLVIQDLGYFNVELFQEIKQRQGYYLSRMKLDARAYFRQNGKFVSKDLIDIVSNTDFNDTLELRIFIRSKKNTYISTRLVIEKLPPDVVNERLRKMNKEAQSRGKQVSHRRKILASYNFYITNASDDQIPCSSMRILYSCRWQIELVFKSWKSNLSFAKLRAERLESVLLIIIAKLLSITIISQIIQACTTILWACKSREISYFRAFKYFLSISEKWFLSLFCSSSQRMQVLKDATSFILNNCFKIHQKDRIYPLARLQMLENQYLSP